MQLKTVGESLSVGKIIEDVTTKCADMKGTLNEAAAMGFKLGDATKGFSLEAVKAALSQTDLNENVIRGVLAQQGLKDELLETATKEVMAAASAKKLGESEGVATVFTKNLKDALRGLGTRIKEILIFLGTTPVGWLIDIVAGLAIASAVYKKFNTSAKEANENMQNAFDESKNQIKSVKEQKDTVDQLSESYEKLSKGVNTSTNENISLSTDSYKEYLDTCNQIADMYPDLVTGYDAQGNAILSLKGNVDQLTESYKKAQQEAYATAYLGSKDENGNRTGTVKDRQKAFEYSTDTFDSDDKFFAKWGSLMVGNQDRIELTTNQYKATYEKMLKMSDDELKAFITDYSANGSNYANTFADTIADGTHEAFDKVRMQVQQDYNDLLSDQKEMLSNEKTALEGYMKGVTDASGDALASGYDKLTERQQNLATSLLSSLDMDMMQAFENSGDFEKAEQKWVDNLVSSVSNMSATAKNAYDKLQDSIANPDDLTTEGINNIDKYLGTLEKELNISKDKLKEVFNLEDIFDTQTSFDNLVKQYLGEDTFNELSNGAKKAAESVDEYGNAIKEAGKSSAELLASQHAHQEAMETANKRLREQNQENTKAEQEQAQKQQEQAEKSAKAHENAMVIANARLRKQRQDETKQQQEDQNKQVENAKKQIDQIANSASSSHKEVASNIQQVWDEADKSVAQSMDNIRQRNKDIINSDENIQNAKQTGKELADSLASAYKSYNDLQIEGHKNDSEISQQQSDNVDNLKSKIKELGSAYIDLQTQAHSSDDEILQQQSDNITNAKNKIKELAKGYVDLQTEGHKYDREISATQSDNIDKAKSKIKELGKGYIDLQTQAHKSDTEISKQQSDNIDKIKSKFKELGQSYVSVQTEAHKNDSEINKANADIFKNLGKSKVAQNFKNAGKTFVENNKTIQYVKDTAKDLLDANAAIQKANDKAAQLSAANSSTKNVAGAGISQVISAQEQLENTRKKNAEAEQARQTAQKQANETLRKQNAEKQKTSERMARKENERAKLSELNSQRTQKQLNSEKEAQEWLSKNYGTMTLSQKKMFLEASEGANTALQAYNNYNKALENNALNSLSIDIADVTEHITNLNTALSESASATGLTADSISNLKSMFSGLDNYDEAALFENTANGIKLNREELDKLNQSYYDQKTDAAKEQLGLLKDKYNDLTSQINMCSDASQTANLYAQRDAVLNQINDVQSLISQYDGLTSAFNEWQNAQNETSPGANYDSIYSYIETANEMAADGKWGNPAFKKFIELMSGQDLSGATITEMKQAWDGLANQIGSTGYRLGDFLTEDGSGVDKFVAMLDKLDDKYVQVGADGENIINIDDMDDLARKMGTDVSFVQVLLDKLSEYGYTINVDSSDLDLATTKAEDANEHLKEIGATDYTFNFNADLDSIDKEIQEAKVLMNDSRFKDANGNFDINIDGAAEAQQILVNLIAKKEELTNHPIIMDIDSSKLEGINKTVIDDLKNLQSYINEYNIKINPEVNMDTTEVKAQVGDALDAIDKIPNDIQDKLGLTNEKVQAATEILKKNISSGLQLNPDALNTIQNALDSIDPEILASLGINMDDVQKDADATAQAFENALTSVLDNLVITVNGSFKSFQSKRVTSRAQCFRIKHRIVTLQQLVQQS